MSLRYRSILPLALLACPTVLQAQGSLGQPAGCGGNDNRALRSAFGATAGVIVGLVAVNIRYSDWSESKPRNFGSIRLNAGVIGGLLGGALGTVKLAPCGASRVSTDRGRGAYSPITTEEIKRSGITGNAYELVYSLRRVWLNTRGIEMSETPQVHGDPRSGVLVIPGNPTIMVYLDHAQLGDMEILKTVPVATVMEVVYYDAAQATLRWGAGHNHGAIQVMTSAASAAR